MTSLFWVIASLFSRLNSLFDCLGELGQRGRNSETTKQCRRYGGPSFANFPVIFPVSREFGAETDSQWTGSSGWESSSNPAPERCKNKVHGFSTDRSVIFALRSASSCRMRRLIGGKNHCKQRITWWAL